MVENIVNKLTKSQLTEIFYEKKIPDFWDVSSDKVTYNVLSQLINFVDQSSLNSQSLATALMLLCPPETNVCTKIGKPSNFRRKMQTFISKNFSQLDQPVEILYRALPASNFIGPLCEEIFLRKENLDDLQLFFQESGKNLVLTNGIVLEIFKHLSPLPYVKKRLLEILHPLIANRDVSVRALDFKIESLTSEASKLRQEKKEIFLRKEFTLTSNPKEKPENDIQNPSQSKESSDC